MKIEIGRNVKGGGVYLTSTSFQSHLDVRGLTRTGKSMLLLHLILQLLRHGKAVIVVDPHWKLVNYILGYLVSHSIGRLVRLLAEAGAAGFSVDEIVKVCARTNPVIERSSRSDLREASHGRHGIGSSDAGTHDHQQWASLNVVAVAILAGALAMAPPSPL